MGGSKPMSEIKTLYKAGMAEQTIERSRFICYAAPVKDRAEADAFIAAVRAKHKDATHNVPAMVIGEKQQLQWASDDGEPQGTSGAPMVQMLVREGLTDLALVVTRYFGGIKLGTGGLVRAYTSSARLGIEAAGICVVRERSLIKTTIDYSLLAKLQNLAASKEGLSFDIGQISYADKISMELICDKGMEEELKSLVNNMSAGAAVFEKESLIKAKILLDKV